jgi:hypothetical protein
MKTKKTFRDLYQFPGFRAHATLKPHQEDHDGYIITLERRQKKLFVPAAAERHQAIGIGEFIGYEIWMQEQTTSILNLSIAGLPARNAKP